MDNVVTPEPHFLPGYTGHCPEYRFRLGKTYGRLSHQLFIDPFVNHGPDLIVPPPIENAASISEIPTRNERHTLIERERFVEPCVYHLPIIPGYQGHIPRYYLKIGKRYMAAAATGVVEHQALTDLSNCDRRYNQRRDIGAGGVGLFDSHFNDRLQSEIKYQRPLIPVHPRSRAVTYPKVIAEKPEPYTKHTVPHFMEDSDPQKFIIKGYGGHIPCYFERDGETTMEQTRNALCDFKKHYYQRLSAKWCLNEDTRVSSAPTDKTAFTVYPKNDGLLPTYAGHVPGQMFVVGMTYGAATVNAKSRLESHKD